MEYEKILILTKKSGPSGGPTSSHTPPIRSGPHKPD